jgi:gliding motility-associated-like protein
LKKNLLIIIGLLCLFNLSSIASNHYWVGGSGSWNDPSHWSAVSGGNGGSSIPTLADNVYFDWNSVDESALLISINGVAKCNDLIFSEDLGTTKLIGSTNDHLEIYGSLKLTEFVQNNFRGEIAFKGTGTKNIDFKYAMPLGDVRFSGDSHTNWNLNSNLFLSFNSKIIIEGGHLNAAGNSLQGFGIQWSGTTLKSLDISNSKMVFAQLPDESGTGNSSVIKSNTHIYPRSSGGSRAIDSIQIDVVRPLCNSGANSCTGSATVTVYPTSGSYSFDWSGPAPAPSTNNPFTNLCAGSYLLTVLDNVDGDQLQQFVQVIAPNPIGANFVRKRPKCFGFCDGRITATVVPGSGTPPYTYLWNTIPAQTTTIANNLCAGTYSLTVKDTNNCTQVFTQILTQPAAVAPNVTSTNVSCFGACTGSATSAPSGGNSPFNYFYTWTNSVFPGFPRTTPTISNLCAGTYSVSVRDDSTCIGTATVTITQPPAIVITPSSTNVTCNGANDGTANVLPVSGGVPPYTYSWTPAGPVGPNPTNLAPGSYTVTVTDANSCIRTATFNITQPAPFNVTATGVDVRCFNECNGSVTAAVSGGTAGVAGFTYNWTPGPTNGPTTSTTNTVTARCDGTYSVVVTDANGCTATSSVTITQPAVLVANPVATNVTCFGLCNGSVTATPTGGNPGALTYLWTSSVFPPAPVGQGTPTISSLCATNVYTVTVTDIKGCTSTQFVTITQPTQLTATIIKTDVTCNNAANGTAHATVGGGTPGYTYVWSGPGCSFSGQGTPDVSGLCPGTYTLVVTDAAGCTKTTTITIIQPTTLAVTVNATTLACNADCNAVATATVTGGTPTYSFNWSGTPIGDTTSVISSLCAGGYTVNVTDAQGCVVSANTTIFQPTVLNLTTSSTNVTCFGLSNGTAQAAASGGTPGYSYLWSPGGFTTPTVSNLGAGTYTVCVTDANGCSICNTIIITQPNQLFGDPTLIRNVTCFGACNGSVYSNVSGGSPPYVFNWTPGVTGAQGQGNDTLINLCPRTYTLVVTDQNLCTSNQTVIVTQPTPFTATISSSTSSCNICNGSATVSVSGGTGPFTYLWAPAASGGTTPTAIGLCPQTSYTVTVTDANGCTASVSVMILQTVSITMTTSNTVLSCVDTCDGVATANASGGAPPYSFIWAPGIGAGGSTVTDLCAGTYSVTAIDANGCFGTDTVTFTNPPALNVTATSTNATCGGTCNGTATANGTGGSGSYSYLWMPGGQTTQTAVGLCAGTYTVTLRAGTCTDTVSVIITEPTPITDNPTFVDANCTLADGSISVAPTGGLTPYVSYVWTGPAGFSGQGTTAITNCVAGSYNLAITDIAGCVANFSYLLNNSSGPTLSMAHTNASCFNSCNGTATVTPTGLNPPYTFSWTPAAPPITGNGTNAVTNLCGTVTYTVTVMDLVGCIALDTATIINPTQLIANPIVVNESCTGLCNGSIALNSNLGGTPPYNYAWSGSGSFTGQGTPTITNLCPGTYTVVVTDNNNCTVTITRTITSPPAITVAISSTNITCNGLHNGTATATASGGSGGPYTYSWSPGGFVLANVVNLFPQTYTVTVGDGSSCTTTATVTITEPPVLTATTSAVNPTCFAGSNGMAIVTPAGGTLPYSFQWGSPGGTNDTLSSIGVGSYTVTVTDGNGCTVSPTAIQLTQPPLIVPNITKVNPTCNGSCNGTAIANPTGGTGTYTYSWSVVGTSQSVSGLCAGAYSATITSPAGCSVTQNFTLTDNPILVANPSSTSPSCVNGCNGTVTAAPVGGTGSGYTYSWTPGSFTTQSVSNLCPNTYTLVVTDANSCRDTQTVVMTNPQPINVVVGSTSAACGVCDGTITVNPVTGVAPFTYTWSRILPATPPVTIPSIPNPTGLCAGLYSLTVTDSRGCDSTFTIPLNNSGEPSGETLITSDLTCNGICNGTASVSPIGGLRPYTYVWTDPAQTTDSLAVNLCADNYFVEIMDANSCIRFTPVTINQPLPITTNASVTNAVCSGVCTGSITLNVAGGTGTYSYVWGQGITIAQGQGTSAVTSLCSGMYTVAVTDISGCVKLDTFNVIQTSPLSATIGSTNISCSTVCNGTAYVSVTTGTPPYAIVWSGGGQTNDTATALCAGTYTATISDALGCSIVLSTTITATPTLSAAVSVTGPACGVCDGSATITPTGGTGSYTYYWSTNDSTATASNLCAGLYSAIITDSLGCTANVSVPVSNIGGITSLAFTTTNVSCNGTATGAVTGVTPTGGTAPYSYQWLPGPATPTYSSLAAGTYTIMVTDASGCSIVDSVTITEQLPVLANETITPAHCNLTDGSISTAASGGSGSFTYLWTGPAGFTGQGTSTITNLVAGLYTLQITDGGTGCVSNYNFTVNNFNGPVLTMSSTNVTCNGVVPCNGTATVNAVGSSSYSYSWNDSGNQTSQTALNLCAGSYTVVVTGADGCIAAGSVSITQPSPIGISIGNTIEPLCNGNSNGSITVVPTGGTLPYSYSWSPVTSGGTSDTLTNIAAGTYTVTLTDGNGCSATQSVILTQPSVLTINNVPVNPSCNTTSDGAIDITVGGGTTPYAFQWSGASSAVTEDLVNVTGGTYSVTATDANGCTISTSVVLTPIVTVTADAGRDTTFCQSGSVTLSATASTNGVTYNWFQMPGNTAAGSGVTVTVNPPNGTTSYYVVVNNGACADNDTVSVTSTTIAATIGSTNIFCSSVCNGTAFVTVNSGTPPYLIAWNQSGQTNDTATALCAGNYSATITDAAGCAVVLNTTITATSAISAAVSIIDPSCGACDGSATITPSGGIAPYTYFWSNNNLNASATNLCSGLYTAVITDSAGCTANISVPVSNSGGLTGVTITSTNITCSTATGAVTSVTPTGGTPPYSYLWMPGGQTTSTISGLTAGVYFVQVTDANNCSIMDSVTITAPAPIVANQIITPATCGATDGSITATATGGSGSYSYNWTPGNIATPTITNVAAGLYTVVITDINTGCTSSTLVTLNSFNGPVLTMSSSNVSCNGSCDGTAMVSVVGNSTYTYLWNTTPGQVSQNATGLCPGDYGVVVSGADGCISAGTVTITQPSPIAFSVANTVEPLCNGTANGFITAIPSGGTLPYTFSWNPTGGTNSTSSAVGAGTYSVTLTDANGCSATQTVTLTAPPVLTISNSLTSSSCNTISDGAIDITVAGGTPGYSYQWSGASTAITEDLSGILSGTYTVTASDANGCTITSSIVLSPIVSVIANAGNDTTFCDLGTVLLDATNSINGINFNWYVMPSTIAGTSATVSVSPPNGTTTYYVVVDNGLGCADSDTISVTSNPAVVADAGADVTIIATESTVIGGSPTGPSGSTFVWKPLPGLDNSNLANPVASPLTTTTYTVTVSTAQGCTATDDVTVTVIPSIVIPDGISPNADGDNDEWVIDGIELFPNCTVEVYNRWGELLFQSPGYKEHWKGKYKGKDLPVGTYYYIIDLKDPLFPDAYTGPITILR